LIRLCRLSVRGAVREAPPSLGARDRPAPHARKVEPRIL
jgi:hypothetical protein